MILLAIYLFVCVWSETFPLEILFPKATAPSLVNLQWEESQLTSIVTIIPTITVVFQD